MREVLSSLDNTLDAMDGVYVAISVAASRTRLRVRIRCPAVVHYQWSPLKEVLSTRLASELQKAGEMWEEQFHV